MAITLATRIYVYTCQSYKLVMVTVVVVVVMVVVVVVVKCLIL